MKNCIKCQKDKPLSEFARRKKKDGSHGYQSYCLICNSEYKKSYYKQNKKKIIDKNKKKKLENRETFYRIKEDLKCSKCGYNKNSSALHFHHIDPKNKTDSITNMIKEGMSHESIINEIEKCEVLCANCHAEVTWPERNKPL